MLNSIRLALCIIVGVSLFYLLENLSFKNTELSDFEKIEGQVRYASVVEYIERGSKATYYEKMKIDLYLRDKETPMELKGIPQDRLINIKTSINQGEHIEVFYRELSRRFLEESDIDVVQINVDNSTIYSLKASKKLTKQTIIQFLAIIAIAVIGLIFTFRSSKLEELINCNSHDLI